MHEPKLRAARMAAFLEALATTGVLTSAAKAAGVDRVTVYRWRDMYPEFGAAYDEAIEAAADRIEAEAIRRAVDGVDTPVIYQGAPSYIYQRDEQGRLITDEQGKPLPELDEQGKPRVLATKTYSDTILILLLKAHRPDKYRERTSLEMSGSLDLKSMSDDDLDKEIAMLAATIPALAPQSPAAALADTSEYDDLI